MMSQGLGKGLRALLNFEGPAGMSNKEQLEELLLRWDELVERQPGAVPADVCGDCPELAPDLERLLRGRKRMKSLLNGGKSVKRPAVDLPEGTAPYEARRMLAEGGLGRVFVADDTKLRREVALKTLRPSVAHHERIRQIFLRECAITGRLNHPGIAPVFGTGLDSKGEPYYAMRLIRGRTLQEAINGFHAELKPGEANWSTNLEFRKLLRALIDACQTIAYAHSRGVVHRDIKPANIMVGPFGETLVVDWGLAKEIALGPQASDSRTQSMSVDATALTDHANHTQLLVEESIPGREMGSPAYMSPEQAQGDLARIRPATDIFGLGATLWTMLAGRARFVGELTPTLMSAARTGKYESPANYRADAPPALIAICAKAMQPDMDDRYQTARDLSDELERWLADEPVQAYVEPWWESFTRGLHRKLPWVTGIAAAALVAAMALGGIAWQSNDHAEELKTKVEEADSFAKQANDSAKLAQDRAGQLDAQKKLAETQLDGAMKLIADFAMAAVQLPELNDPESEKLRRSLLQKALDGFDEQRAGSASLRVDHRRMRALIQLRLAVSHRDWGDPREADRLFAAAKGEFLALQKDDATGIARHRFATAVAQREWAVFRCNCGDDDEARCAFVEAAAVLVAGFLDDSHHTSVMARSPAAETAHTATFPQGTGKSQPSAADAIDSRLADFDIVQVFSESVRVKTLFDLYDLSQRERMYVGSVALPTDRATADELRGMLQQMGDLLKRVRFSSTNKWEERVCRLILKRTEGDLSFQMGDTARANQCMDAAFAESMSLGKEHPTVLLCTIERARLFQMLGEMGYQMKRGAKSSGGTMVGEMDTGGGLKVDKDEMMETMLPDASSNKEPAPAPEGQPAPATPEGEAKPEPKPGPAPADPAPATPAPAARPDLAKPSSNQSTERGIGDKKQIFFLNPSGSRQHFQDAKKLWDRVLQEDTSQRGGFLSSETPGLRKAMFLHARFARAQVLLRLVEATGDSKIGDDDATWLQTAADDLIRVVEHVDRDEASTISPSLIAAVCDEMAQAYEAVGDKEKKGSWKASAESCRRKAAQREEDRQKRRQLN